MELLDGDDRLVGRAPRPLGDVGIFRESDGRQDEDALVMVKERMPLKTIKIALKVAMVFLVILGWGAGILGARRWSLRRAAPAPSVSAPPWTATFRETSAQGTRVSRVWSVGPRVRVERPNLSGRLLTEVWLGDTGWRWTEGSSTVRSATYAPNPTWTSWRARAQHPPQAGVTAVVGGLLSQMSVFQVARSDQMPPWSVTEWVAVDPPGVVTRRDVSGGDQAWRWEVQEFQRVASLSPTLFAPPVGHTVRSAPPLRFEPGRVEGQPLVSGRLRRLEREPRVSLTDLQDGQVLLLQFFSTTCQHCEALWPILRTVEAAYRARGVRFYSIAVAEWGDSEAAVRRFLDQELFAWPVLWDDEDAVYELYAPGAPATVVVDRKGRVTAWQVGPAPEEWYRLKLDQALAASARKETKAVGGVPTRSVSQGR